jgi:NADPH-dependent 7-cyano-7-deazaguanine reductase QueF
VVSFLFYTFVFMKPNEIHEEDVNQVAKSLRKTLTPNQIQEVIDMYPFEQEQDPTGNWSEVVEHCIYQVID